MKALRPHLVPFLCLLLLLTLTAGAAWLPLGAVNLPLSLAIAALKTALVVFFFMELKKENTLIRLTAFLGIMWLLIFLMLALTDYFTRYPGSL